MTYRKLLQDLCCISDQLSNSEIHQFLKSFPLETLVLGYADATIPSIHREHIEKFLLSLRKMQPIISGDDLIKWGEKPSKDFHGILLDLFHAQLDGLISSKTEAFAYFQRNNN